MSDIWMKQNDDGSINGKLTYTDVRDNIPEGYVDRQLEKWEKEFDTEWRWRFLKLGGEGRHVVEVSYLKKGERFFCDKYGNWVNNVEINKDFDPYVVETYYLYTKN